MYKTNYFLCNKKPNFVVADAMGTSHEVTAGNGRSRSALMHVSVPDTVVAAKGKAALDDIHVLQHKKVLLYFYIIIIIILCFTCTILIIYFAIRNQILLLPMIWVLLMKSRQKRLDLVLLLCMSL